MLTKNFKKSEIACNHCGELNVSMDALQKLQLMRSTDGKPFNINSAYRCPEHNAAVGGSKNSQHLKGRAFDISLDGRDIEYMHQLAKDAGFRGIGLYDTFIHVDDRPWNAFWDNRSK